MQKSYCFTPGVGVCVSIGVHVSVGVGVHMLNVRANVKVMEFLSICIFSCILTLLSDCGTSGSSCYNITQHFRDFPISVFCPSGYEIDNASCKPCPVGMYKDNNDGYYGNCRVCPARKTTPSTNSTSVADCSICMYIATELRLLSSLD